MGFATTYLKKNALFNHFIPDKPRPELRYIVVIPAYNEDRIPDTLSSLKKAKPPRFPVELVVVINSSQECPDHILQQNKQTIRDINQWRSANADSPFQLYTIHVTGLPEKDFGAGLARKIGMDEAIKRFDQISQSEGYLLSLDADTLVDENYFEAIEKAVSKQPAINAGLIYFEHATEGDAFSAKTYKAAAMYELFLRYYNQGLRWTGFPYAFHTIGSAFFVKALAYIKQGGMIRRKAGEDFYFLNKIFQLGKVREINSTTVYPSPRPSHRVLFGTGVEVNTIMNNYERPYMVYNPEAFLMLKDFFTHIHQLFHCTKHQSEQFINAQNPALKHFLHHIAFQKEIERINNNCKRPEVFQKHFFHWFGGLKIIRFMHTVHEKDMRKIILDQAAQKMLKWRDQPNDLTSTQNIHFHLLEQYREMEKQSQYSI